MEDIRYMYTGGQDPDAFFEPQDMMNYTGKLYGNIGNNSYFDTGKTGKDWDKLEEQLSIEQRQNEMLIQELHSKDKEIDNLLYCLKQMADYYLHEKEMEDADLELLHGRVIDLLSNPNSI